MSTATYTKITDTPVWKEVKNWSDEEKNELITLLYTSMDIHPYELPEENDEAAFVNEIPRDALAGCVKMALEDHKAGRTIPQSEIKDYVKAQLGWK